MRLTLAALGIAGAIAFSGLAGVTEVSDTVSVVPALSTGLAVSGGHAAEDRSDRFRERREQARLQGRSGKPVSDVGRGELQSSGVAGIGIGGR